MDTPFQLSRCRERPQYNRPILFRHGREHGRSSKNRLPMSQRKSDLGIPQSYTWLNPSTRPKTLRANFYDLDRGTRPAAWTAWRRWQRCAETRRGSSAWWPIRRQAPSQNRRRRTKKTQVSEKPRVEFSRGVDVALGVAPGVRPESRDGSAASSGVVSGGGSHDDQWGADSLFDGGRCSAA